MVWLALVALTVWLVVQQNNLGELKRELTELRRRFAEPPRPPVPTGITPAMERRYAARPPMLRRSRSRRRSPSRRRPLSRLRPSPSR